MIRQGIPVNMPQAAAMVSQQANAARAATAVASAAAAAAQAAGNNFPQQQDGQDIRPHMVLQQMTAQAQAQAQAQSLQRAEDTQERMRRMSEHMSQAFDRSNSLLNKVSWTPTSEYDAALKDKITELHRGLRPSGRSTLTQGLGVSRVLSDVLVERMPEALTAMAEEAISGVDEEEGGEDGGKGRGNEAGLPGLKKRKISELAVSVDKGLEIDRDVESVSSPYIQFLVSF